MILSRWPSLLKLFRFLPERQETYLDLNIIDILFQNDIPLYTYTCMMFGVVVVVVGDVVVVVGGGGDVEIHDSRARTTSD